MPFWGGSSSGIPPFMVMQEILGGDIKFDGAHWAGISEDAIDFVDKLLDRDFNTRMTAEQVGAGVQLVFLFPQHTRMFEYTSLQLATDSSGLQCPSSSAVGDLACDLQALQHPWLVKAEGREDLEECSLAWGLDGEEYAVSVRIRPVT